MNSKEQIIKEWALSKVGCGYVWGGYGQTLTKEALDALIKKYPTHIVYSIVKKWIGKQIFDCATFVSNGIKQSSALLPSGASSQWNSNLWAMKGTIDTLPKNNVCCLYRAKPDSKPMGHTGLYLTDNLVVDARGSNQGVIQSSFDSYPWSHWAIPLQLLQNNELPEQEETTMLYQATVSTESGSLNLRSGATATAKVLIQLPKGALIDVLSEPTDGWIKVAYGAYTGYVMAKYTTRNDGKPAGNAGIYIPFSNTEQATAFLSLLKQAEIKIF